MDGGAGGLLSMGLQRVGHDQATKYSTESGGGSWTKQVGVMKDASLLDLRLVLLPPYSFWGLLAPHSASQWAWFMTGP